MASKVMRCLGLILAAMATPAAAGPASAAIPADPFDSPMWEHLVETLLGNAPVRLDPRVKITVPAITENQRSFPVAVDARGIDGVRRIVLFADLNPVQEILSFTPVEAEPFVAIRIKLDQATPVRAAVELADGSWLVNGVQVDAAGGGCSLPPVSRVSGNWAAVLGQVRGRAWRDGQTARLRLSFRHPMDTGFVKNISAFYIDSVDIRAADGRKLAQVGLQVPVSEDPTLTLIARTRPTDTAIAVTSHDTDGNLSRASVPIGPEALALR